MDGGRNVPTKGRDGKDGRALVDGLQENLQRVSVSEEKRSVVLWVEMEIKAFEGGVWF